jgi:tetratricopeptide (TPR) repeat protein
VATEVLERAAEHARQAGDRRLEVDALLWLSSTLVVGPMPVETALGRIRTIHSSVTGSPTADAWLTAKEAGLVALVGQLDRALELWRAADTLFEQLCILNERIGESANVAKIELLAGNPQAAERELRRGVQVAREIGETGYLSTVLAELAATVSLQERYAEAVCLTEEAEALSSADDALTQVTWRSARATALARIGNLGQAEALAREAVEIAGQTDFIELQGDAYRSLAETLELNAKKAEAIGALEQALDRYRRKGSVLMAERTHAQLAEASLN